MATQRTKGVESARRALEILFDFAEHPELTVDQLLSSHDISLPSAYRYISLLRELDLIEERGKGTFLLSPRVFALLHAAESSLDYREQARTVVDSLRDETGETALYLRRVNDSSMCVAIANSKHVVNISFTPGHLMPLHGGAASKILLAASRPSWISQYLDRIEPELSPAQRTQLEADLEAIRATGDSTSEAEVDPGMWAFAHEVRAHGVVVGAITVASPLYRTTDEKRVEIIDAVRAHASRLESQIA